MATKRAIKKTTKKAVKKVAKKTARKAVKAPAKRAYTRKAVTKAPAKKTAKRAYKRRAPEAVATMPDEGFINQIQANPAALANLAQAEAEPSNQDVLQAIDAIDLRGVNTAGRFQVLNMLENEGYLTSNGKPLVSDPDNLLIGLLSDILRLNHVNKLVGAGDWETEHTDGMMVSRPQVGNQTYIGFDRPQASQRAVIEINGAVYARIG